MLPFAFVLLGQYFFEPMGLTLSRCLVHICRIVKDDKFLTTMVTAQSTHLSRGGCTLSRLTFLYRYRSHRSLHSSGTLSRRCCDPNLNVEQTRPSALRPR